jgi:hypothetical protein
MSPISQNFPFKVVVAGLLAVLLLGSLATPAAAGTEDVALFYDELSPYGQWVDYGNYGPVWYPSRVSENWRPYLDGRWVPTADGWVFETNEPWGWATYHYGNWMPTPEHGWVWAPGRTWYPSTAAWRTSDEFIGWAPIPPPNYVGDRVCSSRRLLSRSAPPGPAHRAFLDFCPGRQFSFRIRPALCAGIFLL